MFNKLIIAFIILSLAACTATVTPTSTPTPPANQIDVEEQAVYAALLAQMYSASSFVIMDTTATDPGGVENTAQTLDHVLQNLHDVDPETANSFRIRNDAVYSISQDMALGVEVTLISQADKNSIFGQNQSGWGIFHDRNSNALGITALSRVGFNVELDQALVYLGMYSDWVNDAGYCVLLNKIDGDWVLDQKAVTWIY